MPNLNLGPQADLAGMREMLFFGWRVPQGAREMPGA